MGAGLEHTRDASSAGIVAAPRPGRGTVALPVGRASACGVESRGHGRTWPKTASNPPRGSGGTGTAAPPASELAEGNVTRQQASGSTGTAAPPPAHPSLPGGLPCPLPSQPHLCSTTSTSFFGYKCCHFFVCLLTSPGPRPRRPSRDGSVRAPRARVPYNAGAAVAPA